MSLESLDGQVQKKKKKKMGFSWSRWWKLQGDLKPGGLKAVSSGALMEPTWAPLLERVL